MADYTTRLETKHNRLSIEFKNLQAQLAEKDEALRMIAEGNGNGIYWSAERCRTIALAAIQAGKVGK